MTLQDRARQLQELRKAIPGDSSDPRDRLLLCMTDTLSEVCHKLWALEGTADALNESITECRDVLDLLFEDEEANPGDEDYFCDDEAAVYGIKCPECGAEFTVEESQLEEGFECPGCHTHLVQDKD